jgi:hypothetical protein
MAVHFQKGQWSLCRELYAPRGFFALRTPDREWGCLARERIAPRVSVGLSPLDFGTRDSLNTSLHTIGRTGEIVSVTATHRRTPSHCRIHSFDPVLLEDHRWHHQA